MSGVPMRAVRGAMLDEALRRGRAMLDEALRHERRRARRRLCGGRGLRRSAPVPPVAGFGKVALAAERVAMRRAGRAARSSRPRSWPRRRSSPRLGARAAQRTRLGRAGVLAMVTWAALGGRSLAGEARRLALRVEAGDLDGAREVLPSLCGRDPAGLDTEGLSRAAVESVAENTADAVVGALLWGAVAGPAGMPPTAPPTRSTPWSAIAAALRVLRVGRGAPRRRPELARCAARRPAGALFAPLVGGSPVRTLRVARRDGAPSQPQRGADRGGVRRSTGLALGGPLAYEGRIEERPSLGDGRPPRADDVERAIWLGTAVGVAAVLLAAGARELTRRRS